MKLENITKNGFEIPNKESKEVKIEELADIIEFINTHFNMIKNINTRHSSYGLKHILERSMGKYISNGELITAMIICGYKHKRYRLNGLNCYFNVGNVNEKRLRDRLKTFNLITNNNKT